jgi:hypothetical protein
VGTRGILQILEINKLHSGENSEGGANFMRKEQEGKRNSKVVTKMKIKSLPLPMSQSNQPNLAANRR